MSVYWWFFWDVEGVFQGVISESSFFCTNVWYLFPGVASSGCADLPKYAKSTSVLGMCLAFNRYLLNEETFLHTFVKWSKERRNNLPLVIGEVTEKTGVRFGFSNICLSVSFQFPLHYHCDPAFQQIFNFHIPRVLEMVICIGDSDSNSCFQQNCTQMMLSTYNCFLGLNIWWNSNVWVNNFLFLL